MIRCSLPADEFIANMLQHGAMTDEELAMLSARLSPQTSQTAAPGAHPAPPAPPVDLLSNPASIQAAATNGVAASRAPYAGGQQQQQQQLSLLDMDWSPPHVTGDHTHQLLTYPAASRQAAAATVPPPPPRHVQLLSNGEAPTLLPETHPFMHTAAEDLTLRDVHMLLQHYQSLVNKYERLKETTRAQQQPVTSAVAPDVMGQHHPPATKCSDSGQAPASAAGAPPASPPSVAEGGPTVNALGSSSEKIPAAHPAASAGDSTLRSLDTQAQAAASAMNYPGCTTSAASVGSAIAPPSTSRADQQAQSGQGTRAPAGPSLLGPPDDVAAAGEAGGQASDEHESASQRMSADSASSCRPPSAGDAPASGNSEDTLDGPQSSTAVLPENVDRGQSEDVGDHAAAQQSAETQPSADAPTLEELLKELAP